VLVGNDLDLAISRFESSQGFNLVDVAGVFLAGPLGLAVTKGYNFASLFRGTGGTSRVDTLVSDWAVERGVARARDVALATAENRIALQGGLDLVNERFADVTVAVIDKRGCASVRQDIRGAFGHPTVEKPRFLRSLAGPALKLFRQTRGIFPSGPCEAFYSGSVPPPK
jgi:AsmA protein